MSDEDERARQEFYERLAELGFKPSEDATTPLKNDEQGYDWEIVPRDGPRKVSYDISVDPDEPCRACGRTLAAHGINVAYDMGDVVPAVGGGYAHKLCVVQEVEVVEIKSLPSATEESHDHDKDAITPDA
jgi:hypothetical protein